MMTTSAPPLPDDLIEQLFPLPSPPALPDNVLDQLFPLPTAPAKPARDDRGSALTLICSLAALGFLGAVLIPKAAALATGEVAQVDLTVAGQVLEDAGLPSTPAAAQAALRADDPGLALSGTAQAGAGRAFGLPGPVGVATDPGEDVLAVAAGGTCWRAVVTASDVRVASERAATGCSA